MLRFSWLLKNANKELKAYDYIGISYYYQGDMDKACYFHEKMMLGDIEKDDIIKEISSMQLQNRQYSRNNKLFRKKNLC